jgi:hypothetical protein
VAGHSRGDSLTGHNNRPFPQTILIVLVPVRLPVSLPCSQPDVYVEFAYILFGRTHTHSSYPLACCWACGFLGVAVFPSDLLVDAFPLKGVWQHNYKGLI